MSADVLAEIRRIAESCLNDETGDRQWALEQVLALAAGVKRRYRVEALEISDTGAPIGDWYDMEFRSYSRGHAQGTLARYMQTERSHNTRAKYRITSAPAQVWTPIEEDQP